MANWIVANKKKVNLDEATFLGGYNYGNGSHDVNYIEEAIYLTKKGNFLFIGEGGANTRYAERVSNNTRSEGKKKYFISKEEAISKLQKWGKEKVLLDRFYEELEEA